LTAINFTEAPRSPDGVRGPTDDRVI
jgi:hypothetical protein